MTRLSPFDPPRLEADRLSQEALRRSLEETLAGRGTDEPLWIFAYGSLMWNPGLDHDVRRVATIHGYHRKFCLWSRINRGTPESPGLVLTLERGGSCRGLAYRLKRDVAEAQLAELWKREMSMGSYRPRWLDCRAGSDRLTALGFVVNRCCAGYAGSLPEEAMVQAIATARGKYGTSADYLFRTEATLAEHGILDTHVKHLVDRVRAHLGHPSAP